jgi:hypothetical protein
MRRLWLWPTPPKMARRWIEYNGTFPGYAILTKQEAFDIIDGRPFDDDH